MSFLETIYSIDFAILDFIQSFIKCTVLDFIMAIFSYIGEAGAIWFLAAIVMFFFKKTRSTAVLVIVAMGIGLLVGELGIKNIICRPRPFFERPDVLLNVGKASGYSFPSGHTSSSFAAATVILYKSRRFGIPALILATLIAFSRLYNYVHFPSDVLCGMILGILCAVISIVIFKRTGLLDKLEGKNKMILKE